jgi:hypothetical protein
MANSLPQDIFNVQFSRLQLELLGKLIDQELYAHESGFPHQNPKLLKRTLDAIWEHIKPTPAEKQKRLESWIQSIYGRKCDSRNGGAFAAIKRLGTTL